MLFNSYIFIFVFLPVTLLGYHLIGKYNRQAFSLGWLVAASLLFYGYWNPAYLTLILLSIIFNYWFGRKLSSGAGRWLLVIGVTVNLALLAYFKYFNFFVDSTNYVLGNNWHVEKIFLPLAISFFTFQQIAYLVDAYRGLCKEYRLIHYCLFVTFFPQLIAGPIVHHGEMLPQFTRMKSLTLRNLDLAIGVTIFIFGLFKKVVIADTFALYATPVFAIADSGGSLSFFEAWQGALAYTFQLYFDFSGYSDMAIGLARMFGIRLPLNFNSPYKAASIIDFWRRWHMTLSRFLRDYLYIALGGSRKGSVRRYQNLLITMVLGGLWHGAGVNFIIWGALHGAYLVVNHAWRKIWPWPKLRDHVIYRFCSISLTMLAVIVGWVFFRAETIDGALLMLTSMMNFPHAVGSMVGPLAYPLSNLGFRFEGGYLATEHITGVVSFSLAFAFVLVMPNTQQWMARYRPVHDNMVFKPIKGDYFWRPTVSWSIAVGVMAMTSLLSMTKVSEFLYFQF